MFIFCCFCHECKREDQIALRTINVYLLDDDWFPSIKKKRNTIKNFSFPMFVAGEALVYSFAKALTWTWMSTIIEFLHVRINIDKNIYSMHRVQHP